MAQTFTDLLRERAKENRGLTAFTLWLFTDTIIAAIKEGIMMTMAKNKDIYGMALVAALILLLPLIGMQFSDEVSWGPGDFLIAGMLLGGTILAYALLTRQKTNLTYKLGAGLAVMSALFLIWMNLAVGLIGNEENPANLMYLAVLAVGLIGAGIARFQPRGMALAMFAMALAQALVAVIALAMGLHQYPGGSVAVIVNLNGFFVVLYVVSALLFRQAAKA
jgi:hypothetical protein